MVQSFVGFQKGGVTQVPGASCGDWHKQGYRRENSSLGELRVGDRGLDGELVLPPPGQ